MTITSPVSRNKYDALTLFAYNVGCDFFKKTAVVKAVNRREPDSAVVKAFADYIWTDGKVCRCSPTVAGTGRCTSFVSCSSTAHCFSCTLALLLSCSLACSLSCLLASLGTHTLLRETQNIHPHHSPSPSLATDLSDIGRDACV